MPYILNPSQVTIAPYKGIMPRLHQSVTVFDGARITGDVEIGEDCTIWYNTVIRGDVNAIRIGKRTNVQDLSMLHVTHEKYALEIGDDVTLGHAVVVHGCVIHNFALIGMGARVLDGAVVHSHSIVAAGAIVRERFIVPEGVLVAGIPAKIVRDLRDEDREMIRAIPPRYVSVAEIYRNERPEP
jgi:carbonic anhydrase/acetyltransferase-like protein (isoleucine patch superfamily)